MEIKINDLINKLEKDFGWENLSVDNKQSWFVETLLKDTVQAIEAMRCCDKLNDLKGNVIEIKSLSDLKKMYPKGTTFSIAGNGRELNYYVNGEISYTRTF